MSDELKDPADDVQSENVREQIWTVLGQRSGRKEYECSLRQVEGLYNNEYQCEAVCTWGGGKAYSGLGLKQEIVYD